MDPEIEFLGVVRHGTSSTLQARRRAVVHVRDEDIIEISDSDDELPPRQTLQPTVAGPSQPHRPPAALPRPLFLPDAYDPESPPATQQSDAGEFDDALDAAMPPARPLSAPSVPQVDLFDQYVAQVVEIVPDVDPEHVVELLRRHIDDYKDKAVEPVLHILFENPDYPKVEKGKGKGKRKREDDDEGPSKAKVKVDYTDKRRQKNAGPWYNELALDRLTMDFPSIPRNHVTRVFNREGALYVPTYFSLDAERKSGKLSYKPKSTTRTSNKGKAKEVLKTDAEFEREREWLLAKLEADAVDKDAALAEKLNEKEYEETGDGIECGCCFSTYPFDKMIQCPEAHLFCTECMCTYSETLLGAHDANIVCMDQSGCKLPFPESELRRFLSAKLLALYDRVKQRKEIEAAGLENLEECPFCDYKVVIDNPDEKLLRCENSECGAVTCRACKKLDHLPKSCKEVEDDKKLDARHTIEEAMTRALMRNCPKCGKGFVKEGGCNKMVCPNCRTLSCYVCRKIITGYEHFNQQPPYTNVPDPQKCQLWDSVDQRHSDEVTAAAKKAIEDYKREHPDVDDKDIQVELPPAPAPAPGANQPHPHVHVHHRHQHQPHVIVHHHVPPIPYPVPPIPPQPLQPPPGMIPPGMQLPAGHYMQMPHGYPMNFNFEPRQMPMPQFGIPNIPVVAPPPPPVRPARVPRPRRARARAGR